MYVTDPARIAGAPEYFIEAQLEYQLGRLSHALKNTHKAPSKEMLAAAVQLVEGTCGITLTASQFSRLVDLYPYEKADLSDYEWDSPKVTEAILNVVAHAFLGTRWPIGADNCDIDVFLGWLRRAAGQAIHLLT